MSLDFLKIWFINLILTIITLGIYGPWAKVRNNHYIYGNTFLGNHSFEYTADPIKILIGRLIVVGFYFVFFVAAQFGFFMIAAIILVLFVLAIPFLIRQALIFRAKCTRFHGLGFGYRISIGDFYKFFIIHFLLNLITVGIIYPYTHSEFKKLTINNTYYGNSNLFFTGRASQFFFIYYIKMFALSILLFIIMAIPLHNITSGVGIGDAGRVLGSMFVIYVFAFIFSFVFKGSFDA
ncbi:MAG: DUF898 domain-containing protein [Campylobacteraceae bacterium]|nr:DUF898 domain-containing protein [Campylobacteraceae bacterium]